MRDYVKALKALGAIGLPTAAIYTLLRKSIKSVTEVPFSKFLSDAEAGRLAAVIMGLDHLEVTLTEAASAATAGAKNAGSLAYRTQLVPLFDSQALTEMLVKHGVQFGARKPHWTRHVWTGVMSVAPILYLLFLVRMVKKMQRGGLDDEDGVGKEMDRARLTLHSCSFSDVAGVDHAKAELKEIVDFLKDSSRYETMGARMPKGVLLSGQPGCGKTLLARAVASESGVPFISCSASDFVEMLVGRGASRVRELFKRGADLAPSIIFIDELDALAKERGGINSNDEREQTLNQLLTEMDGFEKASNVVVIAATNRPSVLDRALLRPGRFDRVIDIGLPDQEGREGILKVHARKVSMSSSVDWDDISTLTDGFSGAELENVVNEAALLSVRTGRSNVGQVQLRSAVERARQYRQVTAADKGPLSLLEMMSA